VPIEKFRQLKTAARNIPALFALQRAKFMRLLGKTCVLTGATGGFGRRLAETFWAEGASLALAARNPADLNALISHLPPPLEDRQKVISVECDLRQREDLRRLVEKATSEFGSVTALVNNAAILGPAGPIWENPSREWEETFQVNLLAPATLCQLVIPEMRKAGYGKIVNLSGGGATSPRPFFSAYAAAKTGLVRLTETIAHETRGMGIDVNCIAPGVLKTRMVDAILSLPAEKIGHDEKARLRQQAEQSDDTMKRAAALALFLVSGQSDGITGRLISAVWDPWENLVQKRDLLDHSDIYTLRRIVPRDRGQDWSSE
jgi:3-oxoacyl-[acyl-carrier protein] reductase